MRSHTVAENVREKMNTRLVKELVQNMLNQAEYHDGLATIPAYVLEQLAKAIYENGDSDYTE